MALQPDILVTRPDWPDVLLVVELRTDRVDSENPDAELKVYMARMQCPAGMLVTPDWTRFYRHSYLDRIPEAIELAGECGTRELFGPALGKGPLQEELLYFVVQQWLGNLRAGEVEYWPESVRNAIWANILPSVLKGEVRAGGPWRIKTGS
jgi:hypothetical protein